MARASASGPHNISTPNMDPVRDPLAPWQCEGPSSSGENTMYMGACAELVMSPMLTAGSGFTFPDTSTLKSCSGAPTAKWLRS
ncbi:hypothetical protein D623_10016139 [Myotis brandtii]|uniref:Uncharacterized protein n=1 Tax=Myotis brandtii TaxID=109478 RepID=S7PG15_MYOBR|nr:hypothetical protein D623_10016139 [Myotis brandtii]